MLPGVGWGGGATARLHPTRGVVDVQSRCVLQRTDSVQTDCPRKTWLTTTMMMMMIAVLCGSGPMHFHAPRRNSCRVDDSCTVKRVGRHAHAHTACLPGCAARVLLLGSGKSMLLWDLSPYLGTLYLTPKRRHQPRQLQHRDDRTGSTTACRPRRQAEAAARHVVLHTAVDGNSAQALVRR